MAGLPGRVPSPSGWRTATVTAVRQDTPRLRVYSLAVPDRVQHLPGQHYVVRLTAPDGYTAARSYSVASPPADDAVELAVERLDGGEVSAYLADEVRVGDELEVRGPVGGWFVWRGTAPALLVGGGSGAVPLVAMLRHARRTGREDLVRAVTAARTATDLPFAAELRGPGLRRAFSRVEPPGSERPVGRLRAADLEGLLVEGQTAFVCGSAGFAEHASQLLVAAGLDPGRVRVERFGPSG